MTQFWNGYQWKDTRDCQMLEFSVSQMPRGLVRTCGPGLDRLQMSQLEPTTLVIREFSGDHAQPLSDGVREEAEVRDGQQPEASTLYIPPTCELVGCELVATKLVGGVVRTCEGHIAEVIESGDTVVDLHPDITVSSMTLRLG